MNSKNLSDITKKLQSLCSNPVLIRICYRTSDHDDCTVSFLLSAFAKPNPRDASEALLKDVQERCSNLHTLLLDHCWLDNANASLLLLPSLHTLEFVWCRLPEGLFRSNAIELLKNLKVLKLYNMTSDADMPHISKLCQLEVLDIRSSWVTDDGLKPIAENLTCLKELYISDTDYSDLGVYHISRGLKNLKVLEMALSVSVFNEVSDLSMYSLASGLPNLTHLYIYGCKNITLEGLLEVVDNLKELEAFHISRIYTLPDFVNCFPQMPRLKDVEIGEIDAEALMVLSQLDLVSLAVDVTGVNCMEFCHLHNCTTLRKLSLQSYTLGSDTVVDSCIEELKANLPLCEVVTRGYSLLPDDEL